jgi:hypothetical protein
MLQWTRVLLLAFLPLTVACGARTDLNLDLAAEGDHEDGSTSDGEVPGDAAGDAPTSVNVPSECTVSDGSSSIGTGTNLSCEEGCPAAVCAAANGPCPTAGFTNCCVYAMFNMVWSNWFYDPSPRAIAYQMNFCETTGGTYYAATP